ncbi:MAG TPA: HlyD family efflux transporter periplasmic adaptor subunit [Kofleriaceae bacterium]|nr:HlyD family efflux transporter periplasmic adaptor subunit [Kofleriaceae bacterium]
MKRAAIAIGVVAALGAGAYAFVTRDHARAGETVATYTAKKEQFVRRVTAEGNLQSVKATPILTPQNSGYGPMKIAWLAPDGSAVKSGDVVVKFDPSDSERRLRDGKSDLDSANARLAEENIKSKNAVNDSETDSDLAGDELEQTRRFQAKDAEIFSRNQIIESEVDADLAGEKQTHAQQAQTIEKRRSQSNAAVIVVDKAKAELAIDHANKALASMQVGAPNDGVFVLERNWRGQPRKVGDQMMPGQAVAEIPLLSSMEAEVYVLEIDGSGLTEKQSAEVVIEARPGAIYHGTIKLVDKLAQPRQNGSPVQYFGVTITLDKTDPAAMKPGQRVQATLVLDQEDAIVVPRQTVFTKEAKSIVYRKTETGFEPITVELGAATAGRVVIKRGLSDGDEIALRDPTAKLDDTGSGAGGSAK